MESRTQGSRPRPRTAFRRTDTLEAKDRNARGQGQGPRTQAQVLSKKKKRSSQKFCCPRAEDRPIFEDLRPRGQGQGLDLRGQGLQNVSSRTPPLIYMTKTVRGALFGKQII